MAWGKDYRQVLSEQFAELRVRRERLLAKQDVADSKQMIDYFESEVRILNKEIRKKWREMEAERIRREQGAKEMEVS